MPFVETSESLRSKLHLSNVSVPVLVGIAALAIAAIGLTAYNVLAYASGTEFEFADRGAADAAPDQAQEDSDSLDEAPADDAASVAVVYVTGCVQAPGVYEVDADARVAAAIDAAGGFAENAAADALNLARVVVDGEQIHIPSVQEAADAQAGANSDGSSASAADPGQASSGLVNINTASVSELQTLTGVGESTARKIIESRESEGLFAAKEDLMRVSGIGEKKYAALEADICV